MTRPRQPRLVVISHFSPFPPLHGNRTRLARLLQWLRENDFAVTFVLQPLEVDDPRGLGQLARLVDRLEVVRRQPRIMRLVDQILQATHRLASAVLHPWVIGRLRSLANTAARRPRGRPAIHSHATLTAQSHHIDNYCWPATCAAVRHTVTREAPLAVLSEYALLSKCLNDLPPGTLKIIDTVEVFLRHTERFQVEGLNAPVVCSPDSEKAALERADVLIAIQKHDARLLQQLFPKTRVITVAHSWPQSPARSGQSDPATILYVGSSNPYNVHGLSLFLEHAWPDIGRHVPDASLRIVGSIPPVDLPEERRITHVGRVTAEQLATEYQRATVVINPQVAGTGLKIKCVEALSAGCPLVTNSAGADGLEDGAGVAFLLAEDWEGFANHVSTILTDHTVRQRLEQAARTYAGHNFSPDSTFSELGQVLKQARARGA